MSTSSRWYRGPCKVTWGDDDLGDIAKDAPVEVAIEKNFETAMAAATGLTPVRAFENGSGITVTVPMLETDFKSLHAGIPGAAWDGSAKELTVDGKFHDITGHAAELVVTPVDTDHSGKTTTVFKAVCSTFEPGGYTPDGDKIVNAIFTGLFDEANTQLYKLGVDDS